MVQHTCIKCSKKYQDNDPDDYYCKSCNKIRKEVAKQIDAKMSGRPKKQVVSAIAAYDAAPKVGAFIIVKE